MSKLCDRIERFQNSHNIAVLDPSEFVELKEHIQPLDYNLGYEIELGLKLSYRAVVIDISSVELIRREARLAISEDIFGEFRKDLLDAKHAIFKREYDSARTILDSLYDKMFRV
jgi:hypothetical protein